MRDELHNSLIHLGYSFLRALSSTDRAPDFGSGGWGFESLRARHSILVEPSWTSQIANRFSVFSTY